MLHEFLGNGQLRGSVSRTDPHERDISMDALCNACSCGPSRIDGHADLMVQSLGEAGMTFECRRCHCLWLRSYSPTDTFVWTFVTERRAQTLRAGAIVPLAGPAVETRRIASRDRDAAQRDLPPQHRDDGVGCRTERNTGVS